MIGNFLLLTLTGVFMGVLTAFVGLPMPWEPIVWVLCLMGWVVFALRREIPSPFVTLLAAGPATGAGTAAIQVLFFDVYQASNPWYAEQLQAGLTREMAAAFFIQGIGAGLVFGLLFASLALAATKKLGR